MRSWLKLWSEWWRRVWLEWGKPCRPQAQEFSQAVDEALETKSITEYDGKQKWLIKDLQLTITFQKNNNLNEFECLLI